MAERGLSTSVPRGSSMPQMSPSPGRHHMESRGTGTGRCRGTAGVLLLWRSLILNFTSRDLKSGERGSSPVIILGWIRFNTFLLGYKNETSFSDLSLLQQIHGWSSAANPGSIRVALEFPFPHLLLMGSPALPASQLNSQSFLQTQTAAWLLE